MSKKTCQICNTPSGIYPLCIKHLQDKKQGLVLKCENCNKWFLQQKGCECQAPQQKEKQCTQCGKPCGEKYDLCYACYTKSIKTENNNTEYTRKAIVKEIGADSTDIRKQWEAMHRTNDGHYVRSYSEVLIDNWLYENEHVHAYEKKVFLKKNPDATLLSDFYIPNGKIYIEFFGLDNEKYKQRKEEKIALYKNNDLKLIVLEQEHIKILDDVLPPMLFKFQS